MGKMSKIRPETLKKSRPADMIPQRTVTITTYKGSRVYLGFLATSAYGNNIYLDDVAVVAQ